jgi:Uma2 family endonuclease
VAVAELNRAATEIDIDSIDVPKGYELFDGELVEKPNVSNLSSLVAGLTYFQLMTWNQKARSGFVMPPETEYACFPGRPRDMRKPDCSFIICDPDSFIPTKARYTFAPDLVVEVLSPSNTIGDMFERFSDFFSAGTKLIWLIDPERRFAQIYQPDFSVRKVSEHESLSGDDVLPGFALPLAEILPPRAS